MASHSIFCFQVLETLPVKAVNPRYCVTYCGQGGTAVVANTRSCIVTFVAFSYHLQLRHQMNRSVIPNLVFESIQGNSARTLNLHPGKEKIHAGTRWCRDDTRETGRMMGFKVFSSILKTSYFAANNTARGG